MAAKLEIPLKDLRLSHNWETFPRGSIIQVADDNGHHLGLRCGMGSGGPGNEYVLILPENGTADLVRRSQTRAGAVDLTSTHELVVLGPEVRPETPADATVHGLLLVNAHGRMFVAATIGRSVCHVRLDGLGDEGTQYDIDVENGPPGVRVGGLLAIRAKKLK